MTDEINALLGFATEQPALQRTPGHLESVIDRAIRTVKALPECEGLDIASEAPTPCVASFDAAKFERVLLNLLLNAAEAVAPSTGRIRVDCVMSSRGPQVRVSDNGPGIPPAILNSAFEPLVSHGKARGTGLGLTIVKSVMQQHGGDALIEHTGPQGTTFLLQFPPAPAVEPNATLA